MDTLPKKHDLVQESHESNIHNQPEEPHLRKKQAISLRRPRVNNYSFRSHSEINEFRSIPIATTISITATASTSVTFVNQDATRQNILSQTSLKDTKADKLTSQSTELKDQLQTPYSPNQSQCIAQEGDSFRAKDINNFCISEETQKNYQEGCDQDDQSTAKNSSDSKQGDEPSSKCNGSPAALVDQTQCPPESLEEPKTQQTHSKSRPSSAQNSDELESETLKQDKQDELADVDEIIDWDIDDFHSETDLLMNIDPIPENTCPICSLDLASLDTMTPDAHVNRCLDGVSSDPLVTEIDAETAVTAPINPLKTIIGTIYASVTNLTASTSSKFTPSLKNPLDKNTGRQFKRKTFKPCPFYKKLPDTGFTVDAFCYGAIDGCNAYFLSHFHSDHYGGLTSSWNHGPIYCSSITANLIISRLNVDSRFVKRLPMYEPTVVDGITVMLMDANHCPGSVLFVYDLVNPRRRYLHTGDFRACPDMAQDPILCQPPNVPIDILYLDTTYINPRYTFPPQDLVIKEAAKLVCNEIGIVDNHVSPVAVVVKTTKKVNIMEKWLSKESGNDKKLQIMSIKTAQNIKAKQKWQEPTEKNRIVVCVGTYLIGKERVFMAIAKAIKSKVFVQPSKLQILSCLEDPELSEMLTSNRLEAQVHLVHMGSEMSPENLQDYLDSLSPTFTRLIAIRPTGWTFTGGGKKYTSADDSAGSHDQSQVSPTPTTLDLRPSFTSPTIKIYPVPYSEHSSFNELAGFVRSLNIAKVIPTVGVGSEKGRYAMNEWFKRWEKERREGIGWEK
ncbi:DNA break repair nuclease [Entomortierella beljakovae]|nr:DNA break repair nuclease [Entomortierella beljakovae]